MSSFVVFCYLYLYLTCIKLTPVKLDAWGKQPTWPSMTKWEKILSDRPWEQHHGVNLLRNRRLNGLAICLKSNHPSINGSQTISAHDA